MQSAGTTLQRTATGAAIGGTVGSVVPGIGTAIGGAIGGGAGLISSFFGHPDPGPEPDTQSPNADYNRKGNFTNPDSYGYQNFTPGAQQQSDFYNQLAATQAGQQAPTVAPVGINFGGATGQAYAQGAPAPQNRPPLPASLANVGPMQFSPGGTGGQHPGAVPIGAGSAMTQRLQSGSLDPSYAKMNQQPAAGQAPGGGTGEFSNPLFKQQQETRARQTGFLDRLQGDMNGGAPSAAQAQLQSGLDQSIAAQNAMAASAGPGNYAAAQRAAQGNAAQMSQQAANQSAILRAQEYAGSRDAMSGALGMTRGQDLTGQGQSYSNAIAQANLQAGQASDQAHLQEDQNKLNVIGAQGYYGMGQHGYDQDLSSRMHMEDLLSGKYNADHGLAQNQSQFDTGERDKQVGTAMAAGSALLPYLTQKSGGGYGGGAGGDGF